LPFGIAAIIFAAQVDSHKRSGNYAAAQDASRKANLWGNLAIGIGLVINIISVGISFGLGMLNELM